MIKTKADLKEYIKLDNALYYKLTLKFPLTLALSTPY